MCTILVVAHVALKTRKIILKNLIPLYDKIFEIPTFSFILAKNEARTVRKMGGIKEGKKEVTGIIYGLGFGGDIS